MRLQRLEISGFKSFCDRAELSFDQGVTAIVGPNGCGKSNVADAIVWVLGEQSAKSLRGDRMEDVIFSGSDARKPNAAAEVRLLLAGVPIAPRTLDTGTLVDADGEPLVREVEVTRRLFRSGESEYLINGDVCRLRDVHDLLMDTGLGAKAYAIIEQGKIGMILSTRPADRRQLIEEAAGVTKYKARRRSAELKLEAAQQNLTRVDDIVFEIEKQRSVLKRQAAKARRYQRLRDELRRWEKVLFARRQRVLLQAIETAQGRLAQVRAQETAAAGRLAGFEGVLERVRIELAELESAAVACREAAHLREMAIGRRQQKIEYDDQQLAALVSRAAEVAAELDLLATRQGPAGQELLARRGEVEAASRERDGAAIVLAEASRAQSLSQASLEGLEGDVEASRSEQYAAASAATALGHAIDSAAAARERVSRDLARLEAEGSDLDVENRRVESDREAASAGLGEARMALDASTLERARQEARLANLRTSREERAQDVRAQEHALAATMARLHSLEEFDEARAAFGDAARLVLGEAGGLVDHQGAVADALDVKPGFERAVEACLGDLLQHVVVPTRADAAAGLRFVRERKAGRCGFVVVANGIGAEIRDEAEPPPPGLVRLSDVVTVSGPHADVLRPLVVSGWIARTLDEALAASARVSSAVATSDGEVCRRGRVIVGGAAGEDTKGILATKREIRDLREATGSIRVRLAELVTGLADLDQQVAAVAAAIESLTGRVHEHEKAIVGYEMRVGQSVDESRRLAQKRELVTLDARRAHEELASLEARQTEARESIVRLGEEQRLVDEKLSIAQQRLFDGREQARQLAERVQDAMAVHARQVERAASLTIEFSRLEEANRELANRFASREDERRQNATDQEALRASLVEGRRLLDEDLRSLGDQREDVRRADEAVTQRRLQADDQEGAIKDARRALESVRTAIGELEVQHAKAENDVAHLASSCQETLQLEISDVLAEVEQLEHDGAVSPDWRSIEVADVDEEAPEAPAAEPGEPSAEPVQTVETQARPLTPEDVISTLKAKIDRLGPVNMMAIEQFDELEQRHGFLTVQRRDLVDSIASTGEAIKRIDQTTRERFREAFDVINTNFQTMFGKLFAGGRAGLTLMDEHDLLESGIEVIAQPPGKRLQNVQLLSGGEKALTAISLMFAIFKYKPSPFCVLDEIDAPLDDANIGRFIDLLRDMQSDTQFILITHNRKTMEIADRLYGVTMEEAGVSKLISVRFN
jgi:chromosome segregation protein